MNNQARVQVATGDTLDVRTFSVKAVMSQLFRVELRVVSPNQDIDFDEIIGQEASFTLGTTLSSRTWTGICVEMDQVRIDKQGLASYTLAIAPRAYLLTQRKNYRIFQFKSELEIVQQILAEWGIANRAQVDAAAHKARKFRVQYAESDFNFVCRMLEDAGISFYFEHADGTTMVLDDDPQARGITYPNVRFHDDPGVTDGAFVTKVGIAQRGRPGKMTIGDLDYRRASSQQPRLSSTAGLPQEGQLEQFDYEPGAFLYPGSGGSTPSADDRGASRTDEVAGARKTKNRLLGKRQDAKRVSFESSLLELAPGSILSISDHPNATLAPDAGLLVTDTLLEGEHDGDWRVHVDTATTDAPFRPDPVTPKPRVRGLESATVVGPGSEEIHTDEYARVRVHFHWDRESKRDENSSCWVPTSQPWAGAGFGGTVLPRIGQEVLVEFFGGDPDRPVVTGRVFTEHQPPPYPLPLGKTLTGIVGKESPALVMGSAMDANFINITQGAGPSAAFRATPPKAFGRMETKNAFLLEDQNGENLVFLQAQRDLNILVKNSWKTVVGNYRGVMVGGDDKLEVRNKQFINVMKDQVLRVSGDQTIEVVKDREEWCSDDLGLIVSKNTRIDCKGVIHHKAKKHITIEAGETIVFRVGSSSLILTKADVTVQSPRVTLNDTCRA